MYSSLILYLHNIDCNSLDLYLSFMAITDTKFIHIQLLLLVSECRSIWLQNHITGTLEYLSHEQQYILMH